MFYYNKFFEKSSIFGENWENPFVEGHDHFEGRGSLATQINVTLTIIFEDNFCFIKFYTIGTIDNCGYVIGKDKDFKLQTSDVDFSKFFDRF